MPMHFATKTALCLVIATLATATAAYADNSYQPYYMQDRDSIQFSHVAQPQYNITPTPPPQQVPGRAVAWQAPAVTTQDEMPTSGTPLPLGSLTGIDLGIQASYYHYNEPSPDVRLTGPSLGAVAAATVAFGNHYFDTLDFRYGFGRVDYNSPQGNSKDHDNEIFEVRDVIGKDFISNNDQVAISPYIGIGYRYLYNDSRGTTDLGFSGYQRDSEYLYAPIGIKPQFRINSSNRVTLNAEYDQLLHGWQTSHFGDSGNGDPTVRNGQNSGFGARGEAMWETGGWAFGPFVNYWNINTSAGKVFYSPNATCGGNLCLATEPHNMTVEGGVQLKYHFGPF